MPHKIGSLQLEWLWWIKKKLKEPKQECELGVLETKIKLDQLSSTIIINYFYLCQIKHIRTIIKI